MIFINFSCENNYYNSYGSNVICSGDFLNLYNCNDNNTLVGIVTVTDIIKYFHEKNKDDNYLAKAMIRYGKYWEE